MATQTSDIYTLYQYVHRENGKRYIGVTSNPAKRARAHAKCRSNAIAFNSAVKKYGIEAFDYTALAIFGDVNIANYHEQAAILKFRTLSPDGYNLMAGAPYTNYRGQLSTESIEKLAANIKKAMARPGVKERHASAMRGNKNGSANKGRVFGSETLAKMSAAQMGKAPSSETCAVLSGASISAWSDPIKRRRIIEGQLAAWARRRAMKGGA